LLFSHSGKRMSDNSAYDIMYVKLWSNQLQRKKLAYRSPDELFEQEIDALYAA